MIHLPWTHKPPYGVKLNRQHPLAQRLLFCLLANEGGGNTIFDLVNNRKGANTNTEWINNGLYLNGTSSSTIFDNSDSFLTPNTAFTLCFGVTVHSYTNYDRLIDTKFGYGHFYGYTVTLRDNNNIDMSFAGGNTYEITTSNFFTLGEKFHCVLAYSGGTTCNVYINGKFDVQLSNANWAPVAGTEDFKLGEYGAGGNNPEVTFDYVNLYLGQLNASQAQSIYANPYQIFEPMFIPSYVAPAGSTLLQPGDKYQVVWNGSEFVITYDDDTALASADVIHIGLDPTVSGGGTTVTVVVAGVTVSGITAEIEIGTEFTATTDTLTVAGIQATIDTTVTTTVTSVTATIDIAGIQAEIEIGTEFTTATDTLTVSGIKADVIITTLIMSITDSVTVSGIQADVEIGTEFTTVADAITIAGIQAEIEIGTEFTTTTDSITASGIKAIIDTTADITATTATINVVGIQVEIEIGTEFTATTDEITITGIQADVLTEAAITVATANITVTGIKADVIISTVITVTTDLINVVGIQSEIEIGTEFTTVTDSITITGVQAEVIPAVIIESSTGAVIITGITATIDDGIIFTGKVSIDFALKTPSLTCALKTPSLTGAVKKPSMIVTII